MNKNECIYDTTALGDQRGISEITIEKMTTSQKKPATVEKPCNLTTWNHPKHLLHLYQ